MSLHDNGSKTLTIGQVLDAIEKNGYPQVKNTYVDKDKDGNLVGCAIGQAAINLGVHHSYLTTELTRFKQKRKDLARLSNFIIYLNDRRGKTTSEIAALAREKFADSLNETISVKEFNYAEEYNTPRY